MRDILLVLAIAGSLILVLRRPFAGILLWTWFTCEAPHQQVYGFSHSIPLNLIIAIATFGALLFSKERKLPSGDALTKAVFAFLFWMTVNLLLAVDFGWSWPLWNDDWKVIILGILVGSLATNEVRIHALVWTIVISLFYYGVKGGLFTLFTGGQFTVLGPEGTIIGDNNQLALALLMSLPLANYLRQHSANRFVSFGLAGGMALTVISVLGSYSRGAFLALGVLAVVGLLRTRYRFWYLISACVVIVPTLYFMPQSFYDRLNTLNSLNQDQSFQGRLDAWKVALSYARDHFPFGAGISGPELPQIFNYYLPYAKTHAAHSIYAQVLGDNGFGGLAIFLSIIGLAFFYTARIRRLTRDRADLHWANELALMIQLTLVAYCAGGAALSMAYYDQFYLCLGLLSALLVLVHSSVKQPIARSWMPEPDAVKNVSAHAGVQ